MKKAGCVALLVGAAMCAMVPAARAEEGVLVESIPANVDKAAAIAAAKDALKYREWKIVGEDADSVSATISRTNINAKIRIRASGSRLLYETTAEGGGQRRPDYAGRLIPAVTATPSRWIEYLRGDTTERLMARAAAPADASKRAEAPAAAGGAARTSNEPAGQRNNVQRLQELKDMLDRGLISADEYARKKDEILKAL